jgi:hypothetical protein
MFTLANQGGGRYFDQRGWVTNPEVIRCGATSGARQLRT